MKLNANRANARIHELELEISRLRAAQLPDILLSLKEVSSKAQTAIVLSNEVKVEVQKLRAELRKVMSMFAQLLREPDYIEQVQKDFQIHKGSPK